MESQLSVRPEIDETLDLGIVLGCNQAFGLLAARCSAAQAEGLRRLKAEKLYLRLTDDWREFCAQYLRMSGAQADRIIALWDEFGPGYFDLAQLTRISPETYRQIEPAVNDGVLNVNGEQIALTVENSRKVAAAVAAIRRTLPAKRSPASLCTADRLARLNELGDSIIEEFTSLPDESTDNYRLFSDALERIHRALSQLRQQFRM